MKKLMILIGALFLILTSNCQAFSLRISIGTDHQAYCYSNNWESWYPCRLNHYCDYPEWIDGVLYCRDEFGNLIEVYVEYVDFDEPYPVLRFSPLFSFSFDDLWFRGWHNRHGDWHRAYFHHEGRRHRYSLYDVIQRHPRHFGEHFKPERYNEDRFWDRFPNRGHRNRKFIDSKPEKRERKDVFRPREFQPHKKLKETVSPKHFNTFPSYTPKSETRIRPRNLEPGPVFKNRSIPSMKFKSVPKQPHKSFSPSGHSKSYR